MLIQKMSHTQRSPRSPGGEKDRTRGDGVLDVVSEALAPGDCDPMGGGGRAGEAAGWRGSEIPPSTWGAKEREEAEEPAAGHAWGKRLCSYKAAPSMEMPGRPCTVCLQRLV